MRRLLAVCAAILLLGLLGAPRASAQISCASTYGTSKMCVTNNSPYEIVGIEAGTFMNPDGNWIRIPGMYPWIAPGQTTMVTFPVWQHGTCFFNVFVKTWEGKTHVFPHLDVCHTTRIVINGGW